MVQLYQKQQERWLIERFFRAQKIENALIKPFESPDFRCEINGQPLGIELVDYFTQLDEGANSPQQQERLQGTLMQRAQAQYFAQENHLSWHVVASFVESCDLRKGQLPLLTDALANMVSSFPTRSTQDCCVIGQNDLPAALQPYIGHLRYSLHPKDNWCLWQPSLSGWVPQLNPETLHAILHRKEQKLPSYRERLPGYPQILLIHVNQFRPSSLASLEFNGAVDSTFDGIAAFTPHGEVGSFIWLKQCEHF